MHPILQQDERARVLADSVQDAHKPDAYEFHAESELNIEKENRECSSLVSHAIYATQTEPLSPDKLKLLGGSRKPSKLHEELYTY